MLIIHKIQPPVCHCSPVVYNDTMKGFVSIIFTIFLSLFFIATVFFVQADELDDINKQLDELNKSLSSSKVATALNEQELAKLNSQLDAIKSQVVQIETDIKKKELDIRAGDNKLKEQKKLLDQRIASLYKNRGKQQDALLQLLVTDNLSIFLKQFTYQQTLLDSDRRSIVRVVFLVKDLEERKLALEEEKERLIPIKEAVAKQSDFLYGEVASAKEYEGHLQQQIVQLSAKQQEILSQRLASLNLPQSLGAGPLICTDDRNRNPGFGNAIAFFTFGIPHRIGMSQYGANGRANAGQSHEDILRAYFNNISFENRNARIKVQGFGEMDLEEYMLGIYEMPNSFHIEALKSQAVAARSYALAYTNNGANEICTTQSCQVYKGGNKGGTWEQAVKETAGKVMVADGQPITAWYASTAGGYTFTNDVVWGGSQRSWTKNLQDGAGPYNGFQDVISNAYDRDSPCMYAAQGWRDEYDKSAWLKSEEVADIVNTLLLVKKDSSTAENLYQTDKPNPAGKETWSAEKVRSELGSSAITTVNDISVSADFGSGRTSTVTINGISFGGSEFKDRFNLRAPANLQIVGPLFNVERR